MTAKQVLIWPNNNLRAVAREVDDPTSEEVQQLCQDLKDTKKSYKAEGVAATQIGVNKRVALVTNEDKEPLVLINPTITSASEDKVRADEGCLSFPGVSAKVSRFREITVVCLDESGQQQEYYFENFAAVAVQHEMDHLDGIVMLDYLGKMEKRLALKKLNKVKRRVNKEIKKATG